MLSLSGLVAELDGGDSSALMKSKLGFQLHTYTLLGDQRIKGRLLKQQVLSCNI